MVNGLIKGLVSLLRPDPGSCPEHGPGPSSGPGADPGHGSDPGPSPVLGLGLGLKLR